MSDFFGGSAGFGGSTVRNISEGIAKEEKAKQDAIDAQALEDENRKKRRVATSTASRQGRDGTILTTQANITGQLPAIPTPSSAFPFIQE